MSRRLRLGLVEAARAQVEELAVVELADRRAVAAFDVVDVDLELRRARRFRPAATAAGCGALAAHPRRRAPACTTMRPLNAPRPRRRRCPGSHWIVRRARRACVDRACSRSHVPPAVGLKEAVEQALRALRRRGECAGSSAPDAPPRRPGAGASGCRRASTRDQVSIRAEAAPCCRRAGASTIGAGADARRSLAALTSRPRRRAEVVLDHRGCAPSPASIRVRGWTAAPAPRSRQYTRWIGSRDVAARHRRRGAHNAAGGERVGSSSARRRRIRARTAQPSSARPAVAARACGAEADDRAERAGVTCATAPRRSARRRARARAPAIAQAARWRGQGDRGAPALDVERRRSAKRAWPPVLPVLARAAPAGRRDASVASAGAAAARSGVAARRPARDAAPPQCARSRGRGHARGRLRPARQS